MLVRWIILLAGLASCHGEIVDSVVASVGLTAIKHSDVLREIRMTALLNHESPNFSPASQKDAANRLVDQTLIHQEIDAGVYVPEDPQVAEGMLKQLRTAYGGQEALNKALASQGFTEEALRKEMQWQSTVIRFVQVRFGGGAGGAPAEDVNDAFFAWLDQMRMDKRVQIREARLQ
jgi:hypothetical protein